MVEISKEQFDKEVQEAAESIYAHEKSLGIYNPGPEDGRRTYLVAENLVRERHGMDQLDLDEAKLGARPTIIGRPAPLTLDEKSGKRQGSMGGLTQ